jgi:hypothetical protein
MKKGDMVECIDVKGSKYLTNGKSYEVVAGKGDNGRFGYISSDTGFEIVDDNGHSTFCLYPECAHAEWRIKE